jgi:hypothetical protein
VTLLPQSPDDGMIARFIGKKSQELSHWESGSAHVR